ncbi:MAG: RNA polymerase sigma factor [Dysgonamonadaceae bacterium]|jgi:RNA polymerase sigma-70 factor (ECF subfamily)|nr:RNA polymerase sigma factor [Dysgonamonadaceae bacterium]
MNALQFQNKIMSMQDNMLRFAMILTANKDDAEDLLQDTTLKALDNYKKYIDNTNFKGWVLTIMRNIFINNYRKIVRNQTVIDQTGNFYHLNLPQGSGLDTPEGAFTIKEINNAITSLTNELKLPFSMYVSGYKYNEISENLNLPLGTIKSRIFLARQELQFFLKDMR